MIDILFENSEFVACVKPVGVPSQKDGAEDMVSLLTQLCGKKVYPIHRLDTAVGGTMVFAKSSADAAKLSGLIAGGGFVKEYLAVIEGVSETATGHFEDLLFKDSRKNKSFVVKRERRGVRKASLDYGVVAENSGRSLVRIKLGTGRSHQIRVQFASRKMPLCGDGKYGSRDNGCTVALWSESVGFELDGRSYSFKSNPDFSIYPWNLFKSATAKSAYSL